MAFAAVVSFVATTNSTTVNGVGDRDEEHAAVGAGARVADGEEEERRRDERAAARDLPARRGRRA